MPHDHSGHHGHHHHVDPDAGDRAVGAAVAINVLLTVAEIVGGILSGSVALIADAVHNLSDAASLAIAWGARKIARRPTDATMTFGYKRAELVAALINYSTLILIGLYLVWEAAQRFIEPPGIDGVLMIAVAGFALVVDLVTALLTYRLSRQSLNIRAAFLHNLADALGSVAVIVVGVLILWFDWRLADPIVTLGIAGYILWLALTEIRTVIRILMLGSPPDIEPGEVLDVMQAVEGVVNVHHLHIWQISEHATSLEAHVVTEAETLDDLAAVKARVRAALKDRFAITHVTLDTEQPGAACDGAAQIGA
ncbi:cation diffusion facilitator family transporter [Maritimibacter fusiformis]|uniref:Cation transporter n=1 Tax=Maritimibacter fusiformis TaxID=2603819 RepID=A0A5D0RGJ8_9RHOB|nr:cation diffusion facilitator family transporter [Maritimibacter fusiformis]TYB80622.1 cation transporter [Maritimibacter fusiformis]